MNKIKIMAYKDGDSWVILANNKQIVLASRIKTKNDLYCHLDREYSSYSLIFKE